MVDLFGADKGNISLPPRLHSPEVIDGEVDDLKHVMIVNMQKAFYEVRIADILRRIQRLQSRNTELEDSCDVQNIIRSQIDGETADQIAQLNRQIFSEVEKITDHRKRIQMVKKWIAEEKQEHLNNVESANEKYARTRLAITSEIKALNAKINTLEEYKVEKVDLWNKLNAGNTLIAQRDTEVKQRCEQIERKFRIGKEKLKKELYMRLQELAGSVQTEVAKSMAEPIHRLVRENMFIKNELINIVGESLPKKEIMKHKKEEDELTMNAMAPLKNQTVSRLITSKIQGYLLAAVQEQHARLSDVVEKFNQSKTVVKAAENDYWLTKTREGEARHQISRLKVGLHRQQAHLGLVKYLKDRSKIESQRCTDVLYDAKYAVACALQMTDTGKDILEMGYIQLLSYLLSILEKGDTQKWKTGTPSLDTIPPPEEAYRIGDLGFEPSYVDSSHRSRITIQRKASNISTFKVLASLGVPLPKINSSKSQVKSSSLNLDEELAVLYREKIAESSERSSYFSESQDELAQKSVESVKNAEPEKVPELEADVSVETDPQADTKVETEELTEDETTQQYENEDNEGIADMIEIDGSVTRNTDALSQENVEQE